MRDPMTWSLPLGRLFGISLRVHVFFLLVIVGLIGRAAYLEKPGQEGIWIEVAFLMFLLFFSVLLHEFGHCFGARAVDGDANEILLWPLGGLAFVDVPQTPKAHFITTAAGPAVNAFLCLVCVSVLATASLVPTFNPLENPVYPVLYNWADGSWVASLKGRGDLVRLTAHKRGEDYVSAAALPEGEELKAENLHPSKVVPGENGTWVLKSDPKIVVSEQALPFGLSFWLVQLSRLFWVNWVLLLLNLIPAFPLDGGRLLQCLLWWRTDYRAGTLAAVVVGFIVMLMTILLSIIVYEPLVLCLAVFIFLACRRQWILLETGGEEGAFGYDFSQGYTSLEKDAPQGPKRQPNFIQRWLQKRAALKAQKEQEKREAEEKRMDELLEKVQKLGVKALTDEERRFLQRVSARFRNRQ